MCRFMIILTLKAPPLICWQTILMKYHTLFFRKLGKMSQNLSCAAVVIGALRVKPVYALWNFLPYQLDESISNLKVVG